MVSVPLQFLEKRWRAKESNLIARKSVVWQLDNHRPPTQTHKKKRSSFYKPATNNNWNQIWMISLNSAIRVMETVIKRHQHLENLHLSDICWRNSSARKLLVDFKADSHAVLSCFVNG